MYGLFGICNTDPVTLFKTLALGLDTSSIGTPTLLGHEPWTDLPIKGIVGVPSVALFRQRFEHLAEAKATVFLFDSAPLLEYLPNMPILDLLKKHVSYQYRFKDIDAEELARLVIQARTGKKHVEVETEDLSLIPTLLNQTQSSLLAPMLTYLYAVPTDVRPGARSLFYRWLTRNKTVDELMSRLPKNKQADNLKVWLKSETGVNTHKAITTMWELKQQGTTVNTAKVAKQFGLAEYDLKYLLIAINKEQLTKLTPQGKKLETILDEVESD